MEALQILSAIADNVRMEAAFWHSPDAQQFQSVRTAAYLLSVAPLAASALYFSLADRARESHAGHSLINYSVAGAAFAAASYPSSSFLAGAMAAFAAYSASCAVRSYLRIGVPTAYGTVHGKFKCSFCGGEVDGEVGKEGKCSCSSWNVLTEKGKYGNEEISGFYWLRFADQARVAEIRKSFGLPDPKPVKLDGALLNGDRTQRLGARDVDFLERNGAKMAMPDDGWVDRKACVATPAYPYYDLGVKAGDVIALGSPEFEHSSVPFGGWRICRVVEVVEDRFTKNKKYRFVETLGNHREAVLAGIERESAKEDARKEAAADFRASAARFGIRALIALAVAAPVKFVFFA